MRIGADISWYRVRYFAVPGFIACGTEIYSLGYQGRYHAVPKLISCSTEVDALWHRDLNLWYGDRYLLALKLATCGIEVLFLVYHSC